VTASDLPATAPATAPAVDEAPKPAAARRNRSVPYAGWMVIGRKEFADHLLSARFYVLLIILALAGGIPIFLATEQIRNLANQASNVPDLFLALFIIGPSDVSIFQFNVTVQSFLMMAAPLLGLAFSFDAVNGERAQGTLPRLLSQPIHRDDVLNGKFAAGIAMIGLVLVVVVTAIGAVGIFRLGIVPDADQLLRLVLWVAVTMVYVGLWLAFGLLLSVVFRRASTSALVGFGVWLLLSVFGGLIVSLINGFIAPLAGSTDVLKTIGLRETVQRLLPDTLYREASVAILNPQVASVSTPDTLGGFDQAAQRIPSLQNFDQSLLLVWPQVVAIVGLTVACFALAYVLFLRQEVRA